MPSFKSPSTLFERPKFTIVRQNAVLASWREKKEKRSIFLVTELQKIKWRTASQTPLGSR